MSLVEEYHRQFPWRDWPRAVALCPITRGQQVQRRYDFRVGRRPASALESQGSHVSTTELTDRELSFDGRRVPV
jgi:hypothetical protein